MSEDKKEYKFLVTYVSQNGRGCTDIALGDPVIDMETIKAMHSAIEKRTDSVKVVIQSIMPLPIIHPEAKGGKGD